MKITLQVSKEMLADALDLSIEWCWKLSATLATHSRTNYKWFLEMRNNLMAIVEQQMSKSNHTTIEESCQEG
eukprot:2549990-Amphidinium_carterae.2